VAAALATAIAHANKWAEARQIILAMTVRLSRGKLLKGFIGYCDARAGGLDFELDIESEFKCPCVLSPQLRFTSLAS
jgi:hypothetical protein